MCVRTRVNARSYAGDATAAEAEATLLLSIVVVVAAVRVRVCWPIVSGALKKKRGRGSGHQ